MLDGIRRESAVSAPNEACGLLFGEGYEITGFQAVENVAQSPETHFEIDPAALFAALRAERAGAQPIAGYWHSHPSGEATPSATDAAMGAPDGKLWLIVSGNRMTAWLAGAAGLHGRFAPVAIETDRRERSGPATR